MVFLPQILNLSRFENLSTLYFIIPLKKINTVKNCHIVPIQYLHENIFKNLRSFKIAKIIAIPKVDKLKKVILFYK